LRYFGLIVLIGVTVLLGWAISSTYGLFVGAGTLAIVCVVGVFWAFQRNAAGTLIGFWAFQLVIAPLSAIVGYTTSTGSALRQINDVAVILFLSFILWQLLSGRSIQFPLRYILPGVGVALCGLSSAILGGVDISTAAQGSWLGLKMWILIALALSISWRPNNIRWFFTVAKWLGVIVALLGIVDFVTHGGVATALHTNVSTKGVSIYRADAIQAIFTNPGEYSLAMSLFFAIALASYVIKRHPRELATVVLFAIAIALALRLKGVLDIGTAIAVVVMCPSQRQRRKRAGVLILAAVLTLGVLNFEGDVLFHQISNYSATSSGTTARGLLYDVSGQIAVSHFPFGVGFGRYASYTSGSPYSTVYDQYGLSGIWGLSRQYPLFISDTSWPSVLGETGGIGLLCFIGGLVAIWIAAYRRFRRGAVGQEPIALALLCALAVLIVDSLGDPNLFDWFAVTTIALLVGPVLKGFDGDSTSLLKSSVPLRSGVDD
jgi:hypothetical protein